MSSPRELSNYPAPEDMKDEILVDQLRTYLTKFPGATDIEIRQQILALRAHRVFEKSGAERIDPNDLYFKVFQPDLLYDATPTPSTGPALTSALSTPAGNQAPASAGVLSTATRDNTATAPGTPSISGVFSQPGSIGEAPKVPPSSHGKRPGGFGFPKRAF